MTTSPLHEGARRAADSGALKAAARVGLAARGLVYVLIGLLAAQIAAGGSEQADQEGALQKVAEQPFGKGLLWLAALGFLAYGLWRFGEGIWGRREEADEMKRTLKRVESGVSGFFYLLFFASALMFATGQRSGDNQKSLTVRLLDAPGGKEIMITLGIVIVGVGITLAWRGLNTDFEKHLNRGGLSAQTYNLVRRLGQAGYIARGAVFALAGLLVVKAALDHDAEKAGGLDVALHSVAQAPHGKAMLFAAAAGFACFGLYSFAEARYRRL